MTILNANGETERPKTARPDIADLFMQLAERANTAGFRMVVMVGIGSDGNVEVATSPVMGTHTDVLALAGAMDHMKGKLFEALSGGGKTRQ